MMEAQLLCPVERRILFEQVNGRSRLETLPWYEYLAALPGLSRCGTAGVQVLVRSRVSWRLTRRSKSRDIIRMYETL